jgi:hypothetical protein
MRENGVQKEHASLQERYELSIKEAERRLASELQALTQKLNDSWRDTMR